MSNIAKVLAEQEPQRRELPGNKMELTSSILVTASKEIEADSPPSVVTQVAKTLRAQVVEACFEEFRQPLLDITLALNLGDDEGREIEWRGKASARQLVEKLRAQMFNAD